MAGPTTPLGVLALGGGVALLWSAFTGQNPLTELRTLLTTGGTDGAEVGGQALRYGTPLAASTSSGRSPGGRAGLADSSAVSGERVSIGQGGHKLNPAAAAAFRQAEQNYRRTIPVTDSTRPYAEQAAQRARNPSRFGPADGNAHVEGRAVDVNLGALGLNPTGEPLDWLRNPDYRRLYDALSAAGFCNYQIRNGSAKGRTREPWHFAYGRCN